jgi:hypothetical protein
MSDEDIENIVEDAPGIAPGNGKAEEPEGLKVQPKQADILIRLAGAATLFHTPDGDAIADIKIDGHRETHRVRSAGFRKWLRHRYFTLTESGCSNEAMQVAIETIAARAQFEGQEMPVHIRVAGHKGAIYIDLGDASWRAIEVTALGWKAIDEPPVRFVRPGSTRALPVPDRGGLIELLRSFCNLKTTEEFVVLVGHILAIYRPDSNYPVLVLTGEQGSCKSTLVRILIRLTDPRAPEGRSPPSTEDNLITAAKGAHVLGFDNISGIPAWLSDAICRLSTGGGASKRKLYEDDEEILFEGRRPILLNGIEDVATRGDLVDRANIIGLETMPENGRRTEAEFDAAFADAAPKILGALLDGLVAGLQNFASIKIADKPRMADAAMWAEACTRAYWKPDTFISAYRASLATSVELVVEASPVGTAVRQFMVTRTEWSGAAQELLDQLTKVVGDQAAKQPEWPKRHNALSNKLRRVAPALRKIGIHIDSKRTGHDRTRIITITRRPDYRPERSSASLASSADAPDHSKINNLSPDNADNSRTMADDLAAVADDDVEPAGTDDADDVQAICGRSSSSASSHREQTAFTPADNADDVSGPFSVCVYCGRPGGRECAYDGVELHLHVQCEQPWIGAHEGR